MRGILACRAYHRAQAAYDEGPITKEQTELLTQVDELRREEDGER